MFASVVDPLEELAWEPLDFLDSGLDVALFPAEGSIPADLDDWAPGLALAAVLETVDRSKLSGFDLVVLLRARWRMMAHLRAEAYADMAEIAHAYSGWGAAGSSGEPGWGDGGRDPGGSVSDSPGGGDRIRLCVGPVSQAS